MVYIPLERTTSGRYHWLESGPHERGGAHDADDGGPTIEVIQLANGLARVWERRGLYV